MFYNNGPGLAAIRKNDVQTIWWLNDVHFASSMSIKLIDRRVDVLPLKKHHFHVCQFNWHRWCKVDIIQSSNYCSIIFLSESQTRAKVTKTELVKKTWLCLHLSSQLQNYPVIFALEWSQSVVSLFCTSLIIFCGSGQVS